MFTLSTPPPTHPDKIEMNKVGGEVVNTITVLLKKMPYGITHDSLTFQYHPKNYLEGGVVNLHSYETSFSCGSTI